jgi:hypothetical protein
MGPRLTVETPGIKILFVGFKELEDNKHLRG